MHVLADKKELEINELSIKYRKSHFNNKTNLSQVVDIYKDSRKINVKNRKIAKIILKLVFQKHKFQKIFFRKGHQQIKLGTRKETL